MRSSAEDERLKLQSTNLSQTLKAAEEKENQQGTQKRRREGNDLEEKPNLSRANPTAEQTQSQQKEEKKQETQNSGIIEKAQLPALQPTQASAPALFSFGATAATSSEPSVIRSPQPPQPTQPQSVGKSLFSGQPAAAGSSPQKERIGFDNQPIRDAQQLARKTTDLSCPLNEPLGVLRLKSFTDNNTILRDLIESQKQPSILQQLQFQQLNRIRANFIDYLVNDVYEEQYKQVLARYITLGIQGFYFVGKVFQPFNPIFRQLFMSLIEVSRHQFNCNSYTMLEILKIYLKANYHIFFDKIIKIAPLKSLQISVSGGSVELNTLSPSFRAIIHSMGEILDNQKRVLLMIFDTIQTRSDLISYFSLMMPRLIANTIEAWVALISSRQRIVQSGVKQTQQSASIRLNDIASVTKILYILSKIGSFSDNNIKTFIDFVKSVIIVLPDLTYCALQTCIRAMRLREVLDIIKEIQKDKRNLPYYRTPALYQSIENSPFTPISSLAYPIKLAVNSRPEQGSHPTLKPVLDVSGPGWQYWFELWLQNRDLNVSLELQQASQLFNQVYEYNVEIFWEHYNSNYLSNTKNLIRKLYSQKQYQGFLSAMSRLIGRDKINIDQGRYGAAIKSNFVDVFKMELSNLCNEKNTRVQLVLHEAFLQDRAKLAPSYLGFLSKLIALSPKSLPSLQKQFSTDIIGLLISALADYGKNPKLSKQIFYALNSLLLNPKTLPAVLKIIQATDDSNVRNHPALEFATVTSEKILMINNEHYIELLLEMTNNLEIFFRLLTNKVIPLEELQKSSWVPTLLRFLSDHQNRKCSIYDVYICISYYPRISKISENLSLKIKESLDSAIQQKIFNYITDISTGNFEQSNRYFNTAVMTFLNQNSKKSGVYNLTMALKILERCLSFISTLDKEDKQKKRKAVGFEDLMRSMSKLTMNSALSVSPSQAPLPKLLEVVKSQFTLQSIPVKSSAGTNFMLILVNLIVLDQRCLFMIQGMQFDNVSLLALRILNRILEQQNSSSFVPSVNKINKILTLSEFTAGSLLTNAKNFKTLKETFIDCIGRNLINFNYEEFTQSIDLLVLLGKSEPELLKSFCTKLRRRIQTMFFRSVEPNFPQQKLYHTMILFVLIEKTKDLSNIFQSTFKVGCFVNALILKCTSIINKQWKSNPKQRQSMEMSILSNLYFILERILLTGLTPQIEQVIANNLQALYNSRIANAIISKSLIKKMAGNSILVSKQIPGTFQPYYISWPSDDFILQNNLKQLSKSTANEIPKKIINCSLAYYQIFKFYLTFIDPIKVSNNFSWLRRKAYEAEEKVTGFILTLRDLVFGDNVDSTMIEDKQPALISLALTVLFFNNKMLSENIASKLSNLILSDDRILTAGGKFLTLAVSQLVNEQQNINILEKITETTLLRDKENGYEILLALLNHGTQKFTESALHLLLTNPNLSSFVTCCRYLSYRLSGLNEHQQLVINTLTYALSQFKQIPMYGNSRRSEFHIKWCWLVLLARELFEVQSIAYIQKIHTILTDRLKRIMQACLASEFTFTGDRNVSSIALKQQLYLLQSYILSLAYQEKLSLDEGALAIGMCSVILRLHNVSAKPHSQFEVQIGQKYQLQNINQNQKLNILQLDSDVLLFTILHDYSLLANRFLESSNYLYQLQTKDILQFEANLLSLQKQLIFTLVFLIRNQLILQKNLQILRIERSSHGSCRETAYLNTTFQEFNAEALIRMTGQTMQQLLRLMNIHLVNLSKTDNRTQFLAFAKGVLDNSQLTSDNLPMLINQQTLKLIKREIGILTDETSNII